MIKIRPLQIVSVASLITVFALDSQTPLGFAHGDLYLIAVLLAAFTGSLRFMWTLAGLSLALTVLGIWLSPEGLPMRFWLTNRLMSITELLALTALTSYVIIRLQRSRMEKIQWRREYRNLKKLTPSPDNPLSPFQHSSQFQLFADAIPQTIWTATAEGGIDFVNRAFARYTGRLREDLINRAGWLGSVHPDDKPLVMAKWPEVIAEGKEYELEVRVQRHDGKWRWLLVQGTPVKDPDGRIIKWCGSAIDIDDLYRLAERFEHVASTTVDAISDWDIVNNVIWWNQGINTLFGYEREDMMSDPTVWTSHLHPEDRDRVLDAIWGAIRGDTEELMMNYRFMRQDGSIAEIEEHMRVVRDQSGQALRLVGGMTDVTERNEMAEQLGHAQRLQTVGELTGGMAHDFNNLLTVIQGNNELLTEALKDNPELADMSDMIRQASEKAEALVQRLLAFARRQSLEPQATDVVDLINSIQPLVRRVIPARVKLELVIEDKVPAVMIDPGQLEHALLNLCLNARDAIADNGCIRIVASSASAQSLTLVNKELDAENWVAIAVEDDGQGMTEDVRRRALDPFFTTKRNGEGSGLGLSMVYGFVKQSGGYLHIQSSPGAGTAIHMLLPVAEIQAIGLDQPQKRLHSGDTPVVLIVEDDELVLQYAERQFRELGYQVLAANHGEQALDMLRQRVTANKPVDLLFTDVRMSDGMNGPQLAREATMIQADLPVMFTSGYTEDAFDQESGSPGHLPAGTLFLSKPWRRADLAQKLAGLTSSED
ncbi:MAG: hypothetical protein CMQ46_14025 [Gammaproteobacteria bacterium]|nr:hypothetical protein [Pseudohongiella sp.]MAY55973.1 hypothetical protein [Gammaproteobacteria bacterium]MBJ56368.1 hypothetical protein [Gammaproteobacteria bacterium]HBN14509.1 hypothetical protein [Pseudohongiella sp.]